MGEMSAGGLTLNVEPSEAAARAPPAAAEGEVGVCAVPPHAATLTTAATARPDRRKVLFIFAGLRCCWVDALPGAGKIMPDWQLNDKNVQRNGQLRLRNRSWPHRLGD